MTALLLAIGLVGTGLYLLHDPPAAAVAAGPSTMFSIDDQQQQKEFKLASNRIILDVEELKRGWRPVTFPMGDDPDLGRVDATIREGRLLINVLWHYGPPEPAIEIKENKAIIRPAGWDWNNAGDDLEVVDEFGRPVFQFQRTGPSTVRVAGYAVKGGRCMAIGGPGESSAVRSGRAGEVPMPVLRPMFLYPSIRHRGEYAAGRDPE